MTTITMAQLAEDIMEDLANDYPDFDSEHVEEMIRNVIACEGLTKAQQRDLREAIADLGF